MPRRLTRPSATSAPIASTVSSIGYAILTVRPVEIDHLEAEPLPASFSLAAYDVRGEPLDAAALGGLDADLGGDREPLAQAGVLAQPVADQRLALAAVAGRVGPEGVAVRGVDDCAAGLDEAVEQGEGGGLVGLRAEVHRAEDEVVDHPATLARSPIVRRVAVGYAAPVQKSPKWPGSCGPRRGGRRTVDVGRTSVRKTPEPGNSYLPGSTYCSRDLIRRRAVRTGAGSGTADASPSAQVDGRNSVRRSVGQPRQVSPPGRDRAEIRPGCCASRPR